MPLPIIELVAQNLLTTVQGVTTDNGYNYTLNVSRPTKGGVKEKHLNAILYQGDPTEMGDVGRPTFTLEWRVPFHVDVWIIPEQDDPTSLHTYANLIRSDIEKISQIDPYRGNYAIDTRVKEPRMFTSPGLEYAIIEVELEVNYRTKMIDPYQQVGG